MLTEEQAERLHLEADALRHYARLNQERGYSTRASALADEADAKDALADGLTPSGSYVVPVDPADATICEACE